MTKKLALMFGVSLMAATGLGFGLGIAGGHVSGGKLTASDAYEWQQLGDGPLQVTVLWGDPATGAHGRLIKLPAGFTAPVHYHSGAYNGVNVAGTWRHTFKDGDKFGMDLPQGSHVFQPAGGYHDDTCVGPEDCIFLLTQDVAADFHPVE
jgi:hypothetical protein